MFGKTKIGARALATLSDRQQTIIAAVSKDISVTLAEWIAGQFVAGRTPDEVWKQLSAARELCQPEAAPSSWYAKSAYNGSRLTTGDNIRHATASAIYMFIRCSSDGFIVARRGDGSEGEFLPSMFAGVIVERE